MHDHNQWVERLAYVFAGIAAVSLAQAALAVTIVAGLLSIVLGAFRLHDRLKHGPSKG